MTALVATLTSLPFTQLRRNRYFYLYYDGFYALACVALLVAMRLGHHHPFVQHWDPRFWLLLPLVCYGQILCSVFIHNATHNSFPRPINRLVGELCGVVVLTRFASWEIIHQRHHRYSDDVENDPHSVVPSYWAYVLKTLVSVERQLHRIYFDLYGDTPGSRRYERRRALFSYGTNLLLIATWYSFLGPIAFGFFFLLPAVVGALHIIHFNWSTHNASSAEKNFRPVNLNHGLFRPGTSCCSASTCTPTITSGRTRSTRRRCRRASPSRPRRRASETPQSAASSLVPAASAGGAPRGRSNEMAAVAIAKVTVPQRHPVIPASS